MRSRSILLVALVTVFMVATAFGAVCFDDHGTRRCTTARCMCNSSTTEPQCQNSAGGYLKCTVLSEYYEYGIALGSAYMVDPAANLSGCGTLLTAPSTCYWQNNQCKCVETSPVFTDTQASCSNAKMVIWVKHEMALRNPLRRHHNVCKHRSESNRIAQRRKRNDEFRTFFYRHVFTHMLRICKAARRCSEQC